MGDATIRQWFVNFTMLSQRIVEEQDISAFIRDLSDQHLCDPGSMDSVPHPIRPAGEQFRLEAVKRFQCFPRHTSTNPRSGLTGNAGPQRWLFVCVTLLFLLPTFGLSGRQSGEYEVEGRLPPQLRQIRGMAAQGLPRCERPLGHWHRGR